MSRQGKVRLEGDLAVNDTSCSVPFTIHVMHHHIPSPLSLKKQQWHITIMVWGLHGIMSSA